MGIFYQFTRRSMAKNPARTIVTMIGILLSMALFTAVCEGAWSGMCFLRDNEIASSGSWHGFVRGDEALQVLESDPEITALATMQTVGEGRFDTNNEDKPYLWVESMGPGLENLLSLHILSGRMPENAQELMLPGYLWDGLEGRYALGDTITLSLGDRYQDGEAAGVGKYYDAEAAQEIRNAQTYTYTLVGVYARLDGDIDPFGAAGCLALTRGGGRGESATFFTVAHPSRFYSTVKRLGLSRWTGHRSLLALVAGIANGNIRDMIFALAGVLLALIFAGSVTLIYNSFTISVTERVRQFGILKSVGATKKQIRACVLYEAGLLSLVAIPLGMGVGCLGIGITLYCLRDAFAQIMGMEDVPMKLVVNLPSLLLAAGVCLATTLVSAWIPARRAMAVSPMEAIRQTRDVQIRQKDVKISPLSARLFGFPGIMAAKNWKRNGKRSRTVVISMALSVVLFISACVFSDSLFDTSATMLNVEQWDISYYYYRENQRLTPEELMPLLAATDGVDGLNSWERVSLSADVPEGSVRPDYYTETGLEMPVAQDGIVRMPYFQISLLSDDAFRQLCRENGLNAQEYFHADAPQAVCYNREIVQADGKIVESSLFRQGQTPFRVSCWQYKAPEGYAVLGESEDGKTVSIYPEVEYTAYLEEGTPLKKELLVTLPREELLQSQEILVTALLDRSDENSSTLVLPASVGRALLKDWGKTRNVAFRITAADYKTAYKNLTATLHQAGMTTSSIYNVAESRESERMFQTVIRVFSYGFIVLMSLISVANIFNTISTNVTLRRREFAMLRSVGMSPREFRRMMAYECVQYGTRGLAWGLPMALVVSALIYKSVSTYLTGAFPIPWLPMGIAALSVFAVVGVSTVYAAEKVRQENILDALKNENI